MKKTVVAIAMGGYSSEAEISIKSGNVVYESLSNLEYEVYCVHILKDSWQYVTEQGSFEVDKASFGCIINNNKIVPDVVFNTIHGTPGEDGFLAAYLKLIGIPQTSTGFYEAALSFNKRDCLSVLKNFGINCAISVYHNKGEKIDVDSIIQKVGLPCFVKPNRAGSSFGVSKVSTAEMLIPSIELAYKEDREIIIESALVGTEVSVGTYKHNGETVSFAPTEIVSENDFFDYEAKYQGKSQEITPARITKEETNQVQQAAIKVYNLLNMKGITRSDFIIQNGTPFFIETNTTPGLSKESIIPKQAKERGLSLSTFFSQLIDDALN
ncbi:D-alanine--D-alanine ligase [Patiriisocius marinus]|uniref:D-alanine--D-alanine ligase n=1 Tax=Patiriisocius marinus TaxID=1397112 RepID=A0A5J4IPL5_9FLAO|nr:D-alanine--D-alanine ligase [Patiriisocius marinus]GER59655.1 D-alanine--D-alanine ligase [Patiriisocius marinus]